VKTTTKRRRKKIVWLRLSELLQLVLVLLRTFVADVAAAVE